MPNLLLVRHSLPEIDPDLPASQWSLSEDGHRRCEPLAAVLGEFQPDIIVTSTETKAVETGRTIAEILGLSCEMAAKLREHDRRNVPFDHSPEGFEAAVARFFSEPEQLVFGRETAIQAQQRFYGAVTEVLSRHAGQNVAIVAHGTVITLFISLTNKVEPFAFWRRLGLPALVVLSLPGYELETVVEDFQ